MPIFLPTSPRFSDQAPSTEDEERWRMFVRASLFATPGATPSPAETYRRIFRPE